MNAIAQNNISGILPSELSALTHLKTLTLDSNSLSGGLPEWISKGFDIEEQIDSKYIEGNFKASFRKGKLVNSEFVLDALILNLQSRIELLNKQLTVVRSINEQENEINI